MISSRSSGDCGTSSYCAVPHEAIASRCPIEVHRADMLWPDNSGKHLLNVASPNERNQPPAYTAACIVRIAFEAEAQRLLLDADSDAQQEGEDGDACEPPPRAQHDRGPGKVEQRAEIHWM